MPKEWVRIEARGNPTPVSDSDEVEKDAKKCADKVQAKISKLKPKRGSVCVEFDVKKNSDVDAIIKCLKDEHDLVARRDPTCAEQNAT
jgi:hypothetical protein